MSIVMFISRSSIGTVNIAFVLWKRGIHIVDCNLKLNILIVAIFTGTYAVQSVMINETGAILEINCVFAPNTEAIGCEVEIVFSSNKQVVGQKTIRANRTGDKASVTFRILVANEYHFNVFEVEKYGSLTKVVQEIITLSIYPFSSVVSVSSVSSILFQMTSATDDAKSDYTILPIVL